MFLEIIIIIFLFLLELRYTLYVEKGPHNILRINVQKFYKNPYNELNRYISDVLYYHTIWRIIVIITLLIIIFINFYFNITCGFLNFFILFIIIFTIIYQCLNWKIHHTYDFIFKSIQKAIYYINKKKYHKFKQDIHI